MECGRPKLKAWSKLCACLARLPRRYKALMVVLGATLLQMPCSLLFYFGNIMTYVVSYYARDTSVTSSDQAWFDPLWVPALYRITQSAGMASANLLEPRAGLINSLALGVVLVGGANVLVGVALHEPACLMLYGLLMGVGSGIVMPLTVKLVTAWMPDKAGMAVGAIINGASVYSLVHMMVAFYFINPENRAPRRDATRDSEEPVFTDPALLGRVPVFFYRVGLATAGLLVMGFLFVGLSSVTAERQDDDDHDDDDAESGDADAEAATKRLIPKTAAGGNFNDANMNTLSYNHHGTKYATVSIGPLSSKDEEDGKRREDKHRKEDCSVHQHKELSHIHKHCKEQKESIIPYEQGAEKILKYHDQQGEGLKNAPRRTNSQGYDTDDSSSTPTSSKNSNPATAAHNSSALENNTRPLQLLTSTTFWRLWLTFVLFGYSMYVHLNLFKQYGLTRISSDQILMLVGILGLGLSFFTRPLLGHLSDRVGFQLSLVVSLAFTVVFTTLMMLSLHFFWPLYILFCTLESVTVMSVMIFYSLAPLIYFGARNYAANFMLLSTSQLCLMIPAPAASKLLISLGWDWLFMSSTLVAALAFLMAMTMPDPPKRA